MPDVDIAETGFFAAKIGDVEKKLDLYDVYNQLVEIQQEHPDRPRDQNVATVALLERLGFGAVSHGSAVAFTNGVLATVGALEKKGESPASATSNAS
jgi:hypothetical protein